MKPLYGKFYIGWKPSFIIILGNVPTGESALSFYFNKEIQASIKECFVNLFYGNNMKIKPVLGCLLWF
jgi:hypothetical protein